MQNNGNASKSVNYEKYVVFKYEDEFGFHYMVMDKLPGGGTYIHGAHLVQEEDQPQLYPGSYHSSAIFGGRQIGLCAQLRIRPHGGLVAR